MKNMKKTYHSPQCETISIGCSMIIGASGDDPAAGDIPSAYNETSEGVQMSKRKGPWKTTLWEEE